MSAVPAVMSAVRHTLGLGVLVTVFASALPAAGLAHAISTALTVGTGMLALALAVVLLVIRRPAPVVEPVPLFEEGDVLVDELAA
jgi:hypothetical protein